MVEDPEVGSTFARSIGILIEMRFLKCVITTGRDRDLNMMAFQIQAQTCGLLICFTPKIWFANRSEYMQFVRILRNMDGENVDANGFIR